MPDVPSVLFPAPDTMPDLPPAPVPALDQVTSGSAPTPASAPALSLGPAPVPTSVSAPPILDPSLSSPSVSGSLTEDDEMSVDTEGSDSLDDFLTCELSWNN